MRLITYGFEENNLSGWGGPIDFVTTPVHSGTYACHLNGSSANFILARAIHYFKTSGSLYTRIYLRYPSTGFDNSFIRWKNSGGTITSLVTVLGNSAIQLTNSITTTSKVSTTILSVNTWYRFELRYLIASSGGEMELRLYLGDATTPLETLLITGENTLNTDVNVIEFTQGAGGNIDWYLDDMAINDEVVLPDPDNQTSWPGPGKIAIVSPNTDVSVQFTKGGSSPANFNWDDVNDVPGTPDDSVTFNTSRADNGLTDKLGITLLPAEVPSNATMKIIHTAMRGNSSGAAVSAYVLTWDNQNALHQANAAMSYPDATWIFNGTNTTLPVNLSGKTKSDLSGYSIGYQGNSGTANAQITAIWANVEWIESSGPPPGAYTVVSKIVQSTHPS